MGIHKKHIFDQEKNKEAHFQPKIKERKHQDKKRNQDLDHAIDQKKRKFEDFPFFFNKFPPPMFI